MWNQIKTLILLAAMSWLLLGIGALMGGRTGLTVMFLFAILMNFGMYFWSHKLVLMMYGARLMGKSEHHKVHQMVEDLARKMDLPKPALYIVPTQTPNAFATGPSPKKAVVACTAGILSLLDERELLGVLAHELSHIKNRNMLVTTIAATIATVISYVASMARFAAIFGGGRDNDGRSNALQLIVLGILAPLIAVIIQLAISRSREYLADERGARFIGDGEPLARALEK